MEKKQAIRSFEKLRENGLLGSVYKVGFGGDRFVGRETEMERGVLGLIGSFGHSINVMKFYGDISECCYLLNSLCRSSRELWMRYRQAFVNGLWKECDRRMMRGSCDFNADFIDYFNGMKNYFELYLYKYLIILQTEEAIIEFCEFIRHFKNRDLIKFQKISIHYQKGMGCDILNHPFNVLEEQSLDTSCIQVEGLSKFYPWRGDHIIKYTHRAKLSMLTSKPQVNFLRHTGNGMIKEVDQICFDDIFFMYLNDFDKLSELIAPTIRYSCKEINFEHYPLEELSNENTMSDMNEKLVKIFPNLDMVTFSPELCFCKLINTDLFIEYVQEGTTLKSSDPKTPWAVMRKCKVFYNNLSSEGYGSFSASRVVVNYAGLPQYRQFYRTKIDSIIAIENIHSKSTHYLSELDSFLLKTESKIFIEDNDSKLSDYEIIIEPQEFELLVGERTLTSHRPSRCENLELMFTKACASKDFFSALKGCKWTHFDLSISNLRDTHLFLAELLSFEVTRLTLEVDYYDLEKITLKAKAALMSKILASNSIKEISIIISSGAQTAKRVDQEYQQMLERVFGEEPDLEFCQNLYFEVVIND
ncbi:unnamed protein product [Moneuplotes crassus]|uniref:Uncharacterized protein n=1 Tax=Euplotes crassus TaxID=5936 RepID=A0AAD1X4F2_EUPCR|nr:unnamed protein product [Moneuplotes crassus]